MRRCPRTLAHALALLLASSPLAAQRGRDPGELDVALLSGLRARAIGPAGMSGRVAAIDAVVADPDRVWVGAATGGLWRSTNGGLQWEPVFDDQPVASIGAVTVFQPSPDVVWVGTGEGNPRNSASVGNGVYRTLDGGRTWTHLGLENTERIHRVVVHPRDRDTAWVAAMGTTWGENPERGVFKTTDGGRSWRKVLYVDPRTGCADLCADPRNPDKLFAAMWDHRRWPWAFRSGGPGSGLYVTHDGGATWTRLGEEHGLPGGELGRVGVAVAPSDPDVVYALVEAERSALYRSDDGGASWREATHERDIADRPFYYCDLRVDPKDPDRVYNLQSQVKVSDDGGRNFRVLVPFGAVHPDHHAMWIHPDDPTFLIEGNDGGVYTSRDRGETWRFIANLPLAQFYHVATDLQTPYRVYGGLQDNGSWRGPSEVRENGGIRNHHWEEVGFGDGFATLPHPHDPDVGYAMSQEGYLHRWDENGERKAIRPPAPEGVELRFNWNAAIAIDPFEPDVVYYGSQFVHRSPDRGDTWEIISPDLTTDNEEWQKQAESGGLTLDVTGAENFTTIMTIAPSPKEAGVLWVGTDDGRLHVTEDAGATWTSVELNVPDVPPHTWIPHIEASRFDAATAYVVFDDHRRSNWTPYVYRTSDFGRTWESLAREPVRGYALTLAEDVADRDLLFLGTEFGLWFSNDRGGHWHALTHGFPTVSAMALTVHPREHDLVVGTHGRAIYVFDDISPLRGLVPATLEEPLRLLPIRPAHQYRVKQTGASRFPGHGEFRGENRPYGALLSVIVNGDDVPHPEALEDRTRPPEDPPEVTVEVRTAAGERVCRFKRPVVKGLNRFAWNLRRDRFRRPHSPDDPPIPDEGPNGPEVLPGDYVVEVRFGELSSSRDVTVLADPRFSIARADREAKRDAVLAMGALQEQLTDAVESILDTRDDCAQLRRKIGRRREHAEHAGEEPPHDDLLEAIGELEDKLDALEARLRGAQDIQGIGPRDHALAKISNALSSLTSSWGAPTPAQRALMERAGAALAAILPDVEKLFDEDVVSIRLRAAGAGFALVGPKR